MLTGNEKLYVSEGDGRASVSVQEIAEFAGREAVAPTWDQIQNKPTTFAPTIGTTATTAKAGNWQPGPNDMAVDQDVKNLLGATDYDSLQTAIGATSTGKLVLTAATPLDAVNAIEAISRTVGPSPTQRGGVLQQTAVPALTDSSGGTSGGNTVAAVPAATAATTDTSAASLTSTNAAITAVKNDIATLAAKLNAVIAAVKAAGVTA